MTTVALVPDSAPFSEEQRAWLNGFLSGFIGFAGNGAVLPDLSPFKLPPNPASPAEEDLDEAPWHDPALAIEERMKLAEGKPLTHKLMAAMAQLDCGSCGYLCKTYSAAIASGAESNLTLCSPGGKETKQLLKQLLKEGSNGEGNGSAKSQPAVSQPADAPTMGSRRSPYRAKLLESRPLNKQTSAKDTRHVVIDLGDSGIKYQVGDALGIFPTNCSQLVMDIIEKLGVEPDCNVKTQTGAAKPLQLALGEECCLKDPSDQLMEALIEFAVDSKSRELLSQYVNDGVPNGFDVLDALALVDCSKLDPARFVKLLSPMNPRLYSIASSMSKVGNQVHLTVGKVTYERDGRERKGVASTMLADRLQSNRELRVFVQPNHGGFTLPSDPTKPIIMVGPGTGVAPFIAFLQEREARGGRGKNWLFFGDQRKALDFLYQEQLIEWQSTGLLTNLDTAFSRDSEKKIYVQDRMRERGPELWMWLNEGAYFYVCGDASRMAADVDSALKEIVAQQGKLSGQEAASYVKQLSIDKRYVRDVY